MDAALLTFFIPAGVLGFIDLLLFLRIVCLLNSLEHTAAAKLHLNDIDADTEEIHDNEINMLHPAACQRLVSTTTPGGSQDSNQSESPLARASGALDPVYHPVHQLHGAAALFLLYCATWTAGAFATSPPFAKSLPHHEVLFPCLYAVLASSLGAFLLVFYCVGRKDLRTAWRRSSDDSSRWQYVKANGNPPQTMATILTTTNGHVMSDTAGETVSLASKSVHSHHLDFEPPKASSSSATASLTIVNLVDASVGAPDCAAAAVFYNPRQNGVARKYWERSKKKRNTGGNLCKEVGGAVKNVHSCDEVTSSQNGDSCSVTANGGERLTVEVQMASPRHCTPSPSFATSCSPLSPTSIKHCIPASSSSERHRKSSPNADHRGRLLPILTPLSTGSCTGNSSLNGFTNDILPVVGQVKRNGSVPRLRNYDASDAQFSEQPSEQHQEQLLLQKTNKCSGRGSGSRISDCRDSSEQRNLANNARTCSLDRRRTRAKSSERNSTFIEQLELRIPANNNLTGSSHSKIDDSVATSRTTDVNLNGFCIANIPAGMHDTLNKRCSMEMMPQPELTKIANYWVSDEKRLEDATDVHLAPRPYAFLNRNYCETAPKSNNPNDPSVGRIDGSNRNGPCWLSRSLSANVDDSLGNTRQDSIPFDIDADKLSASAADVGGLNVWVMQKKLLQEKFKKETSV